jgi:hypothetical protein
MPITGEYVPGPSSYAAKQVETYESSGGTKGTTLRGKPVVILTTVGAKTGKVRKIPLMRVELQDGPDKHEYVAREVTGEEKALWWKRAVEVWPDYARYQRRTDREIPVFVLERADA